MVDLKAMLQERVEQWAYLGHLALMEQFVLRNGTLWQGCKRPRGIKKMANKQCFTNATILSQSGRGFIYCEGIAVNSGIGLPMHHAWCVNVTGVVIDPTWADPEKCTYMGIQVPQAVLCHELMTNEVYGILDLGMKMNVPLMYDLDPGLETIVDAHLARQRAPSTEATD